MFVHLRLHTEFSVVDGTNRIDEVVKAAAADRQPALAITDLNNLFGARQVLQGSARQGRQAGARRGGLRRGPGRRARRAHAHACCWCRTSEGYLQPVRAAGAGLDPERGPRAGAGGLQAGLAARSSQGGLIALSGAQAGPLGAPLLQGQAERAAEVALQLAGLFPHRFYIELQRAGRADDEPHVAAAVQLAARLNLPVVATHPVQFATRRGLRGARGARVHLRGRDPGQPAPRAQASRASSTSSPQAEMAQLFADVPSAHRQHGGDRQALQPHAGRWASRSCRTSRRPTACRSRSTSALPRIEGLEERLRTCTPMPRKRDAERPRYVERLEFEINTILKMGFPGYFLIVADFINWAKNNGCPVGPGRGSGAGSLVAYALKITDLDPLAIQPAVRALPEPRARVDARLRHRLLPGQPRPRHRLREGQVRPRRGEPDRHLRHHGRARRDPRRRPRARHELHLLRRHQQADPEQAGQPVTISIRRRPKSRATRTTTRSRWSRSSRHASRRRKKSACCSSWRRSSKA